MLPQLWNQTLYLSTFVRGRGRVRAKFRVRVRAEVRVRARVRVRAQFKFTDCTFLECTRPCKWFECSLANSILQNMHG